MNFDQLAIKKATTKLKETQINCYIQDVIKYIKFVVICI